MTKPDGDPVADPRAAADVSGGTPGEDAGLIRLMDLRDSTPVFDLRLRAQWRGKGLGGQALRWLTAYLPGEGWALAGHTARRGPGPASAAR